jgi:hypothetical protein
MRLGASLVISLISFACFDPSGPADVENSKAREATGTADLSEEEVEALMALGYLDATEERVDPAHSGVIISREGRTQEGYRLYCTRGSAIAELIDLDGNRVHFWSDENSERWVSCALMPNGDLVVVGEDRPYASESVRLDRLYIRRLNWGGEEIWRNSIRAHHDVSALPDGSLLLLTLDKRIVEEIHPTIPISDNFVVRLTGQGEFVAQRSILDVMRAHPDKIKLETGKYQEGGSGRHFEMIHANSVEPVLWPRLVERNPIYDSGNIVITIRRQHLVLIVEWETNRLLWSWGQGDLFGPHEGHILENGHMLIFDNGTSETGSRVIEINPISKEVVWEYKGKTAKDFFTSGRGGSQRLENGNTLITESGEGRAFEVTREGEIVWEYLTPHLTSDNHRLTFRRMEHYSREMVDRILAAKRDASGMGQRVR